MRIKEWTVIALLAGLTVPLFWLARGWAGEEARGGVVMEKPVLHGDEELATFAGGCFWCLQPPFDKMAGVLGTIVGYTGGNVPNPSYEAVSSGRTGHVEAIQILFDPKKVTYRQLVDEFFHNIDPTDNGGQFADRGSQYRTGIFYHSEAQRLEAEAAKRALQESGKFKQPIVTPITAATDFYRAEEYHQAYYKKNATHYKVYKVGSGRAGFIESLWGK